MPLRKCFLYLPGTRLHGDHGQIRNASLEIRRQKICYQSTNHNIKLCAGRQQVNTRIERNGVKLQSHPANHPPPLLTALLRHRVDLTHV